jgi:cation-transporting P-type ATPase E
MMNLELVSPEEGLTRDEVRQRVDAGLVNKVPESPSRSVAEIVRANVVTRFNLLLGALLLITLFILRQPRDALFGFVLLTNSAIGIIQEVRAKRTLDRLEVLAAPRVSLVRNGRVADHLVGEIVVDDLIELRAGDQLAVDGVVVSSSGLEIDESLLTGESDPVAKDTDDPCLSGSFVAAGSGRYRATRVGGDSYAARLAMAGKRFTLVRSEMRDGIDWILGVVSWAVIPMLALVIWASLRGGGTFLEGLAGGVAAGVAMVPQGLVLLTSIAFAVGVIRLGRRNVLVQEIPAIEGLARVDTVCFDKTGTLTQGRLTVEEITPLSEHAYSDAMAAIVAAEPHPNATLAAIGLSFPESPRWELSSMVPFSSARKWSGATFAGRGTWVIGAPEVVAPMDGRVIEVTAEASERGRRTLLLARTDTPLSDGRLPRDLTPVCVLTMADQVRADAPEILRYFAEQGVRVKVISGDNPETVGAVARQAGLEWSGEVVDARHLPEEGEELAAIMERGTVFGRVNPHQKRAMIRALQSRGHAVAMTGDGVNDVLALKDSDIGIAVGSGAPASRAVAQLVLLDSEFSTLPGIVGEGRRVTSNIERVANLFITSTVYAFGLSLAIIISALQFPFLPRHLTLVGSLTIGIPAFFLALAPSRRRTRSGFVGRVLKFAVPTGIVATLATFGAYWLADLEGSNIVQSRSTATLVLGAIGMFALAIVSRPLVPWKKALISTMTALFAVALLSPPLREFFALELPRLAVLLAALGIVGLTGTVMILALRAVGWAKVVPEFFREVPPMEPGAWKKLTRRIVDESGWSRSFPTTTEMQPVVKKPEGPPPDDG